MYPQFEHLWGFFSRCLPSSHVVQSGKVNCSPNKGIGWSKGLSYLPNMVSQTLEPQTKVMASTINIHTFSQKWQYCISQSKRCISLFCFDVGEWRLSITAYFNGQFTRTPAGGPHTEHTYKQQESNSRRPLWMWRSIFMETRSQTYNLMPFSLCVLALSSRCTGSVCGRGPPSPAGPRSLFSAQEPETRQKHLEIISFLFF